MDDKHSEDVDDDRFVIRLRDNTMYDEVISGLQKMVRRGLEREALVLALGLFDSGYGMALAKRLPIIAGEDVGLAAPDVVAQVCILSSTWIILKKESAKYQPDGLPLMMAVMLMCRAPKNREVDDACVVIREKAKLDTGDTPGDVIQAWETLIVDSHTRRGKERLRKIAEERGVPYEQVAWEDFYKNGAVLSPLKRIDGNKWAHQAYELFGLDYDDVVERAGGL